MSEREYHWQAGEQDLEVRIEESGGKGTLRLGDRQVAFTIGDRDAAGGGIEVGGQHKRFYVHREREVLAVWLDGRTYRLRPVQKGQSAAQSSASASGEIRALMPGKVLRIDVAVGDSVAERQSVVIMESMKMESALVAPKAGKVLAIGCKPGQVVEMGELLVTIGV